MRLLTTEQLDRLKAELSRRLEEARRQMEQNDQFGLRQAMAQDSLGELSNVDNHPADQGSEWFERGKDLALRAHLEREMDDLERALQAIEDGQYGRCVVCGRPIPPERLEAMPTAMTCVEHAPTTVSESRPVEERVIRVTSARYDDEPGGNETEATFYDKEDAWQDVARYNELVGVHEEAIESDERRGYAEEIEGFLATDLYGKSHTYVDNHVLSDYQRRLDEAGVMSILGNPRADDFTLWEGYVDVEQERRRLKQDARSDFPPEGGPPEGV